MRRTEISVIDIRKLQKLGYTKARICRVLHCSAALVAGRLKKAGLFEDERADVRKKQK